MTDTILQEITPPDEDLLTAIGRLRVRAWATEIDEIAQMDV